MPSSACAGCHAAGSAISPERVHWNQNEENAAKYKVNIESAVFEPGRPGGQRQVLPLGPDQRQRGLQPRYARIARAAAATLACANTTKFGNLRFYLAYQNMVGQPAGVTEFSAYNNGGSGANVYFYKGTNDGSNHYTAQIPVPADVPGISVARRHGPRRQYRPDQGAQAGGDSPLPIRGRK